MADPYAITPLELSQFETQFLALGPQSGYVEGTQCRKLFMKSGLSAQILGQIWALSDVTRDGRMDKHEFNVAMTLIRRNLIGLPVPSQLPHSLRAVIPSLGQPGPPPIVPIAAPPPPPAMPVGINSTLLSKQCSDWSLPIPSKNKYRHEFYKNDRQNIGLMSGNQARYVLSQSGIPTPILAQIWGLSDVNKDGNLSPDEFCVAMHLIDMVKLGYQLPQELPNELATIFHNTRGDSISPTFDAAGNAVTKKTTFDDKFRDSYARGEAELERRRQIAREEQERLKVESDRREREEREKRERERQEIERRREAEHEAERQRELERERARQEEEARQRAEREAIRKKLEEERMKELEKIRIRELENQKEAEAEKTAQMQQRHKNMSFQLQALQEKFDSLNNDVTQARDEIIAITSQIEGMRNQRDEKVATMNHMQQSHQQLSIQCERVSHEYLQLQSESRHSLNRTEEIEQLKKLIVERNDEISKADSKFAEAQVKLAEVEVLIEEKMPQFKESNNELAKEVDAYNELIKKVKTRQEELLKKATQKSRSSFAETSAISTPLSNLSGGFGNTFTADVSNTFNDKDSFTHTAKTRFDPRSTGDSVPAHEQFGDFFAPSANTGGAPSVTGVPTKYRALFEFTARSDDELSLKQNDIILVFDSQTTAEPGWLAGQVRGKVGWFPEAFTEPVTSKKSVNTVSSPSSEPLASITEEPLEKDVNQALVFSSTTASNGTYDVPPTVPSLYEIPPVEVTAPETSTTLPQYEAQPVQPVVPAVVSPPTYDTPPIPVASSPATYDAPPLLPQTSVPSYDAPPGDVPTTDKIIAVGVALYRWNAQKEGDLSFGKGDIIEILEQGEMKWRGRLLKNPSTQGWFPKSYVKLNDPPITSPVKPQASPIATSSIKNETALASSAGEWYVALWDFDAAEPTDLTIRRGDRIWVIDRQGQWWKGVLDGKTGIFPATYVEKASPNSSQEPPPAGAVEIAKDSIGCALADFDAAAENQISLRVGELIKIISTSPTGWWEGEVTSLSGEKRTGWFPGNYIELVTDATSPVNGSLT